MCFRLPRTSSPQFPDAQSSTRQGESVQRQAFTANEPTGPLRTRNSIGPMSPGRRSPPRGRAAPATPGNPQQERAVHEFPAQRLEEVLSECRLPSRPFVSDPPPSIERLSADELRLLEGTLRRRFVHGPDNPGPAHLSQEASEAVRAWARVQSARLRRPGSHVHGASLRTEHVDALNDFLQIFHPSMRLPSSVHDHLMIAFNHQRTGGRIPPQVEATVEALGLLSLAKQGYRLDGRTGAFAPAGQLLSDRVLGLSSASRPRTGKLPDSEQYQRIKWMSPEERTLLEDNLETQLMNQAGPGASDNTLRVLDAWLTTQQVRLRIHSEASIQRHAQALQSSPAIGPRMAAAGLAADRSREVSRFHSEHESSDRPEYAIALNNFLRLLHPSTPLPPDLKHRVAERLNHHAEVEGTLSATVVEAMRQPGLPALIAANWQLDRADNVFSPHPVMVIGPGKPMYRWAIPAPHTPAGPISTDQPRPGLSQSTPASAPAPP